MSFQGGLRGCSEVLAPQRCSTSSSAWLPWGLFFEFLSKDFCPLILPRGQQQLGSHLFDWHTILFWLQRELCPCPKSMFSPELSHFAETGWAVLQRAGGWHCLLSPSVPTARSSSLEAAPLAPPSCTPRPQFFHKSFVSLHSWSSRLPVIVLSVLQHSW